MSARAYFPKPRKTIRSASWRGIMPSRLVLAEQARSSRSTATPSTTTQIGFTARAGARRECPRPSSRASRPARATVLHEVDAAVREHQPESSANATIRSARCSSRDAREQERGEHEQRRRRSRGGGRGGPPRSACRPSRDELVGHEEAPREVEAELRGDPRQRDETDDDREPRLAAVPRRRRRECQPRPAARPRPSARARAQHRAPESRSTQRASRSSWSTTPGMVAHSAERKRGAAHQRSARGSAASASRTSAIATSATGKLS